MTRYPPPSPLSPLAVLAMDVLCHRYKIWHRQKQIHHLLLPKGRIPIFRTRKKASTQIPVVQNPKLSPPTLGRPCTQFCSGTVLDNMWEGVLGGPVHSQTSCLAEPNCADLLRDSSPCTCFEGRLRQEAGMGRAVSSGQR